MWHSIVYINGIWLKLNRIVKITVTRVVRRSSGHRLANHILQWPTLFEAYMQLNP